MTRRDKIGESAFCRYVLEVAWLYVKMNQTDMAQEYLDEIDLKLNKDQILYVNLHHFVNKQINYNNI